MARADRQPCEHLVIGPYPFSVELVIDEHMGITDAVVRCSTCGQHYLIECLGAPVTPQREFRVLEVDAHAVARYAHDIDREYCDLNRKSAELYALQTHATLTARALTLDVHAKTITSVRQLAADEDVAMVSWRTAR